MRYPHQWTTGQPFFLPLVLDYMPKKMPAFAILLKVKVGLSLLMWLRSTVVGLVYIENTTKSGRIDIKVASRSPSNVADVASEYAHRVVSHEQIAGELTILACQRQMRDLSDGVDGYDFDLARAARVVNFIEKLKHFKGSKFSGQPIVLEPWQIFNLSTIYGWVDELGLRRFRTVYWGTARKSGKSTVGGGVGLYAFAADGEPGAEVYSVATGREQAKIVWETARALVLNNPELRSYYPIRIRNNTIIGTDTFAVFKPLAKDMGGSHDGLNTHMAIMDEMHAWKGREQFEVIETSISSREQPMLFIITTAGFNTDGICYETEQYAKDVLHEKVIDESFFANIYRLDDGDNWKDSDTWIKANPNLGVSTSLKDLQLKANAASSVPSKQPGFITKCMNVWCSSSSAWLGTGLWDSAADKSLTLEKMAGLPCVIGVDLSSKIDMTSVSVLFRDGDQYVLLNNFFLPSRAIEISDNIHYASWAVDKHINVTEGSSISMIGITEFIRSLKTKVNLKAVAYDPFNASMLAESLSNSGINMIEIRPTKNNFSDPMKMIESLLLDGKLIHDGNPVMSWMCDNVEAQVDTMDRVVPVKPVGRKDKKIDGVVSLIMAMGRARIEQKSSVYADRGVRKF